MYLSQLMGDVAVNGVILSGERGSPDEVNRIAVRRIVTDSRRARPGDVFLCIEGTHTDGHLYARDAVRRGAVAVVAQRGISVSVPTVTVECTRTALSLMWNKFCGEPARDMILAAVTGTNGKTSVSFMLRHILMRAGYKAGLMGTVRCMAGDEVLPIGGGSEIEDAAAAMTTPDPEYLYGTLREMRLRGVTHTVMEASSHAISQKKLTPLVPTVAVFTGLSREHLDYHGTMENYFMAKSELFRDASWGIINTDSPYGERLYRSMGGVPVSFGMNGGDFCPKSVRYLPGEAEYTLHYPGGGVLVRCSMPGEFGVMNSLAAIAAADVLGIPPEIAAPLLRDFPGVPGRMERLTDRDGITVIRDYAHTPEALERAARIAKGDCRGRLWLLFGCGGDRDPTKRPLMGRIATEVADVTLITSDNSRSEDPGSIIRDILEGVTAGSEYRVIPDRREAIRCAVLEAMPGDTVLLLGKGHEDYEITSEGKFPFDEAVIVADVVEERLQRKDAKQ